MRDGIIIRGKEIRYMDKLWTIKEFYYVENNPDIYVKLYDGNSSVNVMLDKIKSIILNCNEK
jgi:hypothetical protein